MQDFVDSLKKGPYLDLHKFFFWKDNLICWQVERYDPIKGSWTAVTPMLTKRCRLGVATLNDKLYVCGGYDGATFLQSVEMYDPDTDKYVAYTIQTVDFAL